MTISNDEFYELLWSFSYLSVHRYGGAPSGEVLLVLTILMLDHTGQNVTVSELAEITGLPQSNVSRYVSDQLAVGHLQEEIDPSDRRRRVLHPTEAGRIEQGWLKDQLLKVTQRKRKIAAGSNSTVDMVRLLSELTRCYQQDTVKDTT